MGTQWYRGQLGLTLQRTLIRHSEGQEAEGLGWCPTRTGSPQEGPQRRLRDEVTGKSSILFLKGILLFYTIALPRDWRVAFRVREP